MNSEVMAMLTAMKASQDEAMAVLAAKMARLEARNAELEMEKSLTQRAAGARAPPGAGVVLSTLAMGTKAAAVGSASTSEALKIKEIFSGVEAWPVLFPRYVEQARSVNDCGFVTATTENALMMVLLGLTRRMAVEMVEKVARTKDESALAVVRDTIARASWWMDRVGSGPLDVGAAFFNNPIVRAAVDSLSDLERTMLLQLRMIAEGVPEVVGLVDLAISMESPIAELNGRHVVFPGRLQSVLRQINQIAVGDGAQTAQKIVQTLVQTDWGDLVAASNAPQRYTEIESQFQQAQSLVAGTAAEGDLMRNRPSQLFVRNISRVLGSPEVRADPVKFQLVMIFHMDNEQHDMTDGSVVQARVMELFRKFERFGDKSACVASPAISRRIARRRTATAAVVAAAVVAVAGVVVVVEVAAVVGSAWPSMRAQTTAQQR
mmetsp:Transcript_12359/g.33483  ORF Transcript_12359/g.33483 Transcript_12359/m.33483 type:complete len:434 (+) Transcript_12359:518-1819(+)